MVPPAWICARLASRMATRPGMSSALVLLALLWVWSWNLVHGICRIAVRIRNWACCGCCFGWVVTPGFLISFDSAPAPRYTNPYFWASWMSLLRRNRSFTVVGLVNPSFCHKTRDWHSGDSFFTLNAGRRLWTNWLRASVSCDRLGENQLWYFTWLGIGMPDFCGGCSWFRS